MKLYIPTTTLNFNNILSTESISPKGFYSIRGFGYSRWFSIPENDIDGAIIMYEAPAKLNRPISEIEDHPLWIEISTDEDYPVLMPGVRYSDKTLYLNPWNTSLIFQSERDKNIALSLSDSSLETKLLRLYNNKIVVRELSGSMPDINGIDAGPINKDNVRNDIKINKIKGLLYGYYIGASLSASPDVIARLSVLREIQNIFSSITSSEERIPTKAQYDRLSKLFGNIAKQNPLYEALLTEIGDNQKTDNVVSVLLKYGVRLPFTDWRNIVNQLKSIDTENQAIIWIKRQMENTLQLMTKQRVLLPVDDAEIITEGQTLLSVSSDNFQSDEEKKLYLYWVNNLFCQSKYNGKISSVKTELADDLTKSAITCLGDRWNDSHERTFLNQLRRHVRGEEFTMEWHNGLLSSVAAILTKGDDWEALLKFMQSKGMTDYRIAMSIFGVLNGFANLTRDFTDVILNEDSKYVSDMYREFYGQIHNIRIDTRNYLLQENQPIPFINKETVPSTHEPKVIESKLNSPIQSNSKLSEPTTTSRNNFITEILNYFETKVLKGQRKEKREQLRDGLNQCIDKNRGLTDPSNFIMDLNQYEEYGWSRKNKPWQLMQERFFPKYDKRNIRTKDRANSIATMPSMFDEPNLDLTTSNGDPTPTKVTLNLNDDKTFVKRSLFIEDPNCITFLQGLIPKDCYEKFVEGLTWFQGEYAKGANSKYYAHAGHDNQSTIEAFKRFLSKRDYASRLNLEEIYNYLKQIYGK
jgi:hypothetical protein